LWQDASSSLGVRINLEITEDEKVKIVEAMAMITEYGQMVQ
jgi:hypothetical protein